MSITNATLGGYPLLASAPVEWSQTEGVRPHEAVFHMIPRMARELVEKGGPTTLTMETNGRRLEVKGLWVLDLVPLANPQIIGVRVADRRWLLNRKIILRRYNMRRNIGHKRVGNNAQPVLNDVTPDVWYWPWSLKIPGGTPPEAKWSPVDVLKDILDDVEEFEKKAGGGGGYIITQEINRAHRTLPVESFQIDDKADMAILRSVGLFPEAGFTVTNDGQYKVFSKIGGGEVQLHKQLGPNIVGGGYAEVVEHSNEAPEEIEIFFTIESEVRFDYQDDQTVDEDDRYMDNVLAVPDFNLVGANGQQYVQGSWIIIDPTAYRAWGAGPTGSSITQITNKLVQRAMIPFLDLWAALVLTGQRDPDKDWAGRVGSLMTHWRKTFRINKHWMDRFLTIRPYRVGIIDPENGVSAPAEAYCDYSFIGTQRSFFKEIQGNADLRYATNVEGYPTGGQVPGLSAPGGAKSFNDESIPAPARVSIVDADMGIIRVEFQSDQNHMFEAALPGLVVREDGQPYIPSANMSDPRKYSPTFDSITEANQIPRLSNQWKLATVFTAVPSSPNDQRQLFKITVKFNDIKDLLPASAAASLSQAKGPTWQVRVQPGSDGTRALVRWLDSRAADIERLFGIGEDKTPPNLDGLILNFEPNQKPGGLQAASLNSTALAIAAAVYSRYAARLEGGATGMLNPNMSLDGFLEAITHRTSSRGEATTTLTMARQGIEFDMMSMLDSHTRAILLRQPHPEK